MEFPNVNDTETVTRLFLPRWYDWRDGYSRLFSFAVSSFPFSFEKMVKRFSLVRVDDVVGCILKGGNPPISFHTFRLRGGWSDRHRHNEKKKHQSHETHRRQTQQTKHSTIEKRKAHHLNSPPPLLFWQTNPVVKRRKSIHNKDHSRKEETGQQG